MPEEFEQEELQQNEETEEDVSIENDSQESIETDPLEDNPPEIELPIEIDPNPIDGENGVIKQNSTSNIDRTYETVFTTPTGDIHVIHEVTLGDITITLLLTLILILMIFQLIIRR